MSTATKRTAKELLAENLRRLRQGRHKSQEQLAAEAGFHRSFVSQVERQANNVTLESLDKLATALDVEVAALFRVQQITPTQSDETTAENVDQIIQPSSRTS